MPRAEMTRAAFLIALLALPAIANAKGETTRIEIARGAATVLELEAEAARDFTIWSGPGTGWRMADGSLEMGVTPLDYADWTAGPVTPPAKLVVYDVRFYCAARPGARGEAVRDMFCYGVRYAIDPQTGAGYFQIPPSDDPEFPL
ncbi:MAG TPA: hypothetical protein VFO94_02040, partial [Gammaproteobacteria bacterium]|nr:hypothetical protein [Gammaproteobacteria bacterium]